MVQSTFTALTPQNGERLAVDEFEVVANNAAADNSNALIVYSRGSGNLFYNPNGARRGFGTGGEFAVLEDIPTLTARDILVA